MTSLGQVDITADKPPSVTYDTMPRDTLATKAQDLLRFSLVLFSGFVQGAVHVRRLLLFQAVAGPCDAGTILKRFRSGAMCLA